MNKRGAGVSFCFMAVILFLSRYFIAGVGNFADAPLYIALNGKLGETNTLLLVLSVISLLIGIIYLVLGEVDKNHK